ncbi:hypothetical protein AB0J01_41450 [Streptomyces sp. NPDC050204]|uniref:hypothetical protein n=1 Tax=Streptomyces sp. NPDC050204 TaxID=3155514 RepID=UPI003418EDAC
MSSNHELERVPRPALNGDQMACVSARFAMEETPAIAHFAAVHHHVEEILGTVAVNDKTDWILGNIARVRADLDVLEQAVKAGETPLNLTKRHGPTRLRTAFFGIPSGLRQPLDASKGPRDFSVAYRPARPRKDISDVVGVVLCILVVVALNQIFF